MIESNSCCIPVHYAIPTTGQQIYSWAVEYTTPWSRTAVRIIKIDELEGIESGVKITNEPSLAVAILKIVSYCLLLFFIIAEVIKAIHRSSYKLKIEQDTSDKKNKTDEKSPSSSSRIHLPATSPFPSNIASPREPGKPKAKKVVTFQE